MTRSDCLTLDARDPLAVLREQFALPAGKIYLDGNSLGVLPKATAARVAQVVQREWGEHLIESWNTAHWIHLPQRVGNKLARLVGAGQVSGKFSWSVLIYSILSLTVVRMLPVYLSLAGSSFKPGSRLFLGWFGPRGLANVAFAVIVLHHHLPGGQELELTAACTVILSILAHGFSANPLAALLGKRESSRVQSLNLLGWDLLEMRRNV